MPSWRNLAQGAEGSGALRITLDLCAQPLGKSFESVAALGGSVGPLKL